MHTDDQFMVSDRMHLGQSVELKTNRDLIIKNGAAVLYKTPITEENIDSDANLNISTNENADISNMDKGDRNRQNIHGETDSQNLQNIGLVNSINKIELDKSMGNVTDDENLRASSMTIGRRI